MVGLCRGKIALCRGPEVQSLGLLRSMIGLRWRMHCGIVWRWIGHWGRSVGMRWERGETSRNCSGNKLDTRLMITLAWWRICWAKTQRLCLTKKQSSWNNSFVNSAQHLLMHRNMRFSLEMEPIAVLQRCLEEKLLTINSIRKYQQRIFSQIYLQSDNNYYKKFTKHHLMIIPLHLILGYWWGICWLRGWFTPIAACWNIIRGCVRWSFGRQKRIRLNVVIAWWQWPISMWDWDRIGPHFWDKVRRSWLVEQRVFTSGRVASAVGRTWHWRLHS